MSICQSMVWMWQAMPAFSANPPWYSSYSQGSIPAAATAARNCAALISRSFVSSSRSQSASSQVSCLMYFPRSFSCTSTSRAGASGPWS